MASSEQTLFVAKRLTIDRFRLDDTVKGKHFTLYNGKVYKCDWFGKDKVIILTDDNRVLFLELRVDANRQIALLKDSGTYIKTETREDIINGLINLSCHDFVKLVWL